MKAVQVIFEYHVENDPDPDDANSKITVERLNELGSEGWQMMGYGFYTNYNGEVNLTTAIFMRVKR